MYSAADLHALSRVLAAFVLANATPSRETGAVRKLFGSRSPSHEPSQAPNDPYGALRAAEGHSRLKRRRSPLRPAPPRMVGRTD